MNRALLLLPVIVLCTCHATVDIDSGDPSSDTTNVAPREWGARRLCPRGFQVVNRLVETIDPDLRLGVKETTATCRIQQVEFSNYDPASPFSQIFELWISPGNQGTYQLHNPKRPFNSLSVALDARGGGYGEECADETSRGDGLLWTVQSVIDDDVDSNEKAWFELSPATEPQRRLAAVISGGGYHLELANRTLDVPAAEQWSFTGFDMCDRAD